MTASRFWTLTDSEWTVRAVNANPKTGGGGAGGGGGGGPTKRPGGGWGKGGKPGGGGGDPFAADVVFLTNFDGTHGGTDATDEGPFSKALVFNGNAVLSNADTYSADYGTSLLLDGAGDWVDVADFGAIWDPGSSPWTAEIRAKLVNPFSSFNYAWAVTTVGGGDVQFLRHTHDGVIQYADNRGGGFGNRLSTAVGIGQTNVWQELAVSFDGDFLYLYKNGTLLTSGNPSNTLLAMVSTNILRIGTFGNASSGFWVGNVQAARFTLADRYGGASYTPEGRWSL